MANENSLNTFKTKFKGGTRANRFVVDSAFPSGIEPIGPSSLKTGQITISSASLPKSDVGVIGVPFRGRMAYYAGDRQYSVWPIKIYDDNNNVMWRAFQRWKEAMDGHITHKVKDFDFSYTGLQKDWLISQTDLNGGGLATGSSTTSAAYRQIKLIRCWPSEVGGINFDLGSSDFVTFDVTLTFDYIQIIKGL